MEVLSCQPLIVIEHTYRDEGPCKDPSKGGSTKGDKTVRLEVFLVDNFQGTPSAQEGQGEGWFSLAELQLLEFPAANKEIITKLVAQIS